jgi:hypothetical protein
MTISYPGIPTPPPYERLAATSFSNTRPSTSEFLIATFDILEFELKSFKTK